MKTGRLINFFIVWNYNTQIETIFPYFFYNTYLLLFYSSVSLIKEVTNNVTRHGHIYHLHLYTKYR